MEIDSLCLSFPADILQKPTSSIFCDEAYHAYQPGKPHYQISLTMTFVLPFIVVICLELLRFNLDPVWALSIILKIIICGNDFDQIRWD